MTKKITITISQDGTGNNKSDDTINQSNVARLHDMVKADYSFDISEYDKQVTDDLIEVKNGIAEGSKTAFDNFLLQQKGTLADDSPLHIKIYQDGVGSGPKGFNANVEGGTGKGTALRVEKLRAAIKDIHETYGEDVEIDLNAIGFSRGSVAIKQLLNELSEDYPNGEIHLNNVLLFDPVASMGNALTETHLGMKLHYPTIADDTSNITEFYAANEYRTTFALTAYQDENVMRQLFPGAHSQVGGGYISNILAAGPLAAGMRSLSKGENGLEFEKVALDDIIRMRIYNAVIESPALVRALITDSRIVSGDTLNPGTNAFPFEYGQDYHFDEPIGHRGVIDERPALAQDPFTRTLIDGFTALTGESDTSSLSYKDMMSRIYLSDISIDSIANQNYQKIILPQNYEELPIDMELALFKFELAVRSLSDKIDEAKNSADNPLTDSEILQMAVAEFEDISQDFKRAAGNDNSAAIATKYIEGMENRLGTTQISVTKEEIEQAAEIELATDKAIRAETLDFMSSQNELQDAINEGDGIAIAEATLEFLSAGETYADRYDSGLIDDDVQAGLDALASGLGLAQAIDDGDGWEIAGETAGLILDIDTYLETLGPSETDNTNYDFIGEKGEAALGAASAALSLGQAIDSNNGWGIAQSTTQLLESVHKYIVTPEIPIETTTEVSTDLIGTTTGKILSGVGSAIGLASNIASFDEVLESGDAVKIAYQTVSTVNNAINTYNAIAGMVDGIGVISNLSSVGSLIGSASGSIAGSIPVLSVLAIGAQLAMGDVRGAAVTAATTVLMACGPWGWAAAAVLQLVNMVMGDDPPSATADFFVDENGNIVMGVHGDSEMQEGAEAAASPLVAVIQNYKDGGGRVTIDDSLPSLYLEAGEDPQIRYSSEYGGNVIISVENRARLPLEMRGALYARDHGDRIDDAVTLAKDANNKIDFSKVDAALAAMGYIKQGSSYSFGESYAPKIGTSYGNGIFTGGGNASGPQGQHFVASNTDIKSMPLTPDKRPSQTIGELLRTVSLQHNFAGASGLLLAMGLGLDVDQACASALLGEVKSPESNSDYIKPLGGMNLSRYLAGEESVQPEQEGSPIHDNNVPIAATAALYNTSFSTHLQGLTSDFEPFSKQDTLPASSVTSSALYPQASYSNIPEWWKELSTDHRHTPNEQYPPSTYPAPESPTNNIRIDKNELPEDFEEPPLSEGTSQGVYFSMVQDSALRFLPSTLTNESPYSASAESYTLLTYGNSINGEVYEDANGDLRFKADPGFSGTASFEYTLLGPGGEHITRRALVVVEDLNDAPLLNQDHFIINEGEPFYLDQLLANDSDADGDTIVLDHVRGLENGTITEVDNRLLFTPDNGFTGTLTFSYMAHDGTYPQKGEASLTVVDKNLGPNTTNDRFIILEDHSLTTTAAALLANDHEYDGESIELTSVHSARNGEVSMDAHGNISFTPDPDYAGTDAGFSYTVTDQSGKSSSGKAIVEVLDQREAPQVSSTTYPAINEDEPITFCPEEIAKFVSDADGDQLHLDSITNIQHGSVVVENGFFKFIPEAGYSGTASFDYQANDSHRGTVQGHLEFEILPVNDAVVMGEETYQTTEETPLTITVADLLANDSDPEGGAVEFVSVGNATHGTVTTDGNGTIQFTPAPDYFGSEAGFFYTVKDEEGLESSAFVTVAVQNSNDAPEAGAETLSTNEDQAITFDNSTIERFLHDADGDTLHLTSISNVSGGVISEHNGTYTFTPHANYHGAAFLDYSAADGNGATIQGTLDIDVVPVDDATVFGADILTTDEEVAVSTTIDVLLANDSDVEGPLHFAGLGATLHGTASQDEHGAIIFAPDADYFGNEAGFEYKVEDRDGNQSTTWVQVNIANVNDAPAIIETTITTNEDQPLVFDAATIAQFIDDRDGEQPTIKTINSVNGGTVTKDNNGLYTFTPSTDYHGLASLEYTIEDAQGATVSGRLDIDILSVNDATTFGDDTLTTEEEVDVSTTLSALMANDHDRDGELTFINFGAAVHGTLHHSENGDIIFRPDLNYFGQQAGFEYTVEDAEGNRETTMVPVHVTGINDAPTILFDQRYIDEDQSIVFEQTEMATFINDPDGDQLQFSSFDDIVGGSLTQTNGVYTYTPDPDFYGTGQFSYTVHDGNGAAESGTMTIHIAPVNDLPTVAKTSATMAEDGEITFEVTSLMAGASDVEDGSDLRFMGISASSNGDGWVDEQGLLHFLPDDDFFGTATLNYAVADTETGIGTGVITITVLGANDAPVAMDDDRILAWSNNSYDNVYSAAALLANDLDVDSDPLQISSLGNALYGTVSQDQNGFLHYQAASDDWVGIDTFTYTITDGNGGESQATATIDVKLNTSPDAYSEILFSQEDVIAVFDQQTLLANDSDVDGDTLFITAVGNGEHGTVTLRGDGKIEFTPELNFNNHYPGQASFEYTVSDGISDPVTAVAFVDLDPVNDAPILIPETISGAIEDNSFEFTAAQLIANDYDIEMESSYEEDSISFTGVLGAVHGSIAYDPGTGSIYYSPNANFCGTETFQYQVSDSTGAVSTVTSEIYVQPVNDNPVAQEDIASPAETLIWNKYSIAGLVGNDYDVDGDTLTIVNPHVSSGSASVKIESGYLWVKPTAGQRHVEVGYTVSDGHGGTAPSRLIMNQIVEHNFAPELSIGSYGWDVDSIEGIYDVNFNIVIYDRNSEDTVTVSAAQVNGGTVYKNSNTSFDFSGQLQYGHPASFTLTGVDQRGASATMYIQMRGGTEPGAEYKDYTFRLSHSPVILDLDGDGVELLGIEEGVTFDWNRDTIAESSGWVGPDDGFLAYDHNHDRAVTRADELILKEYLPGATTDLEGLRAFDSNDDGLFNKEDEAWEDFGVWQDKNSDGVSDEGEFMSLDEAGITDIALESDGVERELAGNTVYGSATYHKEDGSSGEVGDVALRGETIEITEQSMENSESGAEQNDIAAPEELATHHTDRAEQPQTTDEAILPDDAEINRLTQQLQSDAAAGSQTGTIEADPVATTYTEYDAEADDNTFQNEDEADQLLPVAA